MKDESQAVCLDNRRAGYMRRQPDSTCTRSLTCQIADSCIMIRAQTAETHSAPTHATLLTAMLKYARQLLVLLAAKAGAGVGDLDVKLACPLHNGLALEG
mmetsp:Transcript_12576/g.22250  ORF Transcript_12576/g.22250 Transcript_12576/m.22250 type:complete len:100 (+) Transcript_12576:271-570(+)